jgi:hypothetical protein
MQSDMAPHLRRHYSDRGDQHEFKWRKIENHRSASDINAVADVNDCVCSFCDAKAVRGRFDDADDLIYLFAPHYISHSFEFSSLIFVLLAIYYFKKKKRRCF